MTISTAAVVRPTGETRKQFSTRKFHTEQPTFVRHHTAYHPIRSTEMSLFIEELARDRTRQAQRDAETYRLARQLRAVRRTTRRGR
jgi:hypothetical protein